MKKSKGLIDVIDFIINEFSMDRQERTAKAFDRLIGDVEQNPHPIDCLCRPCIYPTGYSTGCECDLIEVYEVIVDIDGNVMRLSEYIGSEPECAYLDGKLQVGFVPTIFAEFSFDSVNRDVRREQDKLLTRKKG